MSIRTLLFVACTCDLHSASCDVNCCCDPDCTAKDKNTFTVCKDIDKK